MLRSNRPVRYGSKTIDVNIHQELAIECHRERAPEISVRKERSPQVPHQRVDEQEWIVLNSELRVRAHETGVCRKDSGKVELARGERSKLGGCFINDNHDETFNTWPSQVQWECGISLKNPSLVWPVHGKPEWTIPNRRTIEIGFANVRGFDTGKPMRRQDGQVRKHIRKYRLLSSKADPDGERVYLGHIHDLGKVPCPRIGYLLSARHVQRPHHVMRASWHAVVPRHISPEFELQHAAIGGPVPPREARHWLKQRVIRSQRHKEHVLLDGLCKRMHGEEWIDRLEIGA